MPITPEILAAASELEILARRKMTALLEGNTRTAFRGSSMQFKEFRPYEPGDDIRHMSWSVTARTGRPTIKIYEQERELDVILVVDASGSTLFGNGRKRKVDMFGEIVATVGISAIGANDNFGLLLFNDKVTHFLKPGRRSDQVRIAITHLLSTDMEGRGSKLNAALEFVSRALRHRSLCLILSDFWVDDFEARLSVASRRHECILLHGYEDREMGAGLEGFWAGMNPETGETLLVDGNSRKNRELLRRTHWEHRHHLEAISQRTHTDLLSLSVEDDYVHRLVLFFERRGPTRL